MIQIAKTFSVLFASSQFSTWLQMAKKCCLFLKGTLFLRCVPVKHRFQNRRRNESEWSLRISINGSEAQKTLLPLRFVTRFTLQARPCLKNLYSSRWSFYFTYSARRLVGFSSLNFSLALIILMTRLLQENTECDRSSLEVASSALIFVSLWTTGFTACSVNLLSKIFNNFD